MLPFSAGVLLSSNIFSKLKQYFEIQSIEKTKNLVEILQKGECLISGAGRCDNSDYNAKCLHYTIMGQMASKTIRLSVTQV